MDQDQAKQLIRRMDSLEKTLNLLYADRTIFEDISIRLGKVEDQVKYSGERVAKLEKNLTADLADVSDKVDDTKDTLDAIAST